MKAAPFTVVLGIAQDAGYPSAGCNNECCAYAWETPELRRHCACLAIVDPRSNQRWMVDCTPDFREQLQYLNDIAPPTCPPVLDGIFLTHAHIGHYTGLMQLGREVLGAKGQPVFAMPQMRRFLESNAPWSQLASLNNIAIQSMVAGTAIQLNGRISITPLLVPHRGEYSETVGFRIEGPSCSTLYIPDIDSWEGLNPAIEQLIASVDVAYLDATFFSGEELPGRNMAEIPHPTIQNSVKRFAGLPDSERSKIRFLHLNHTNPALDQFSDEGTQTREAGYCFAIEGERFGL